jgi:ribosomal protein S16
MLVIRMQRTGRKGHAQFRVVVQDSRVTPTSGKVVAALGSYDPHAKTNTLNKEKAEFYLTQGTVRNPDKRRSTSPAPEVEEVAEAPAEVVEDIETPAEEPVEVAEAPVEEATPAEVPAEETPAEEPAA